MTSHRKTPRYQGPAACSALAVASAAVIPVSAGPLRLAAGLSLLGALAAALWLRPRARPRAIVAAIGLTLAFLVLAGLALAAAHALSTGPTALTTCAATLAAAWAGTRYPGAGPEDQAKPADLTPRPRFPRSLAVAGVLVFAVTAALAVRYSAASATADSDAASSLAVWAYPAGGQLHVGARQPAGHGAASLRIVVTQAGVTAAAWDNVRLAPGQSWAAPALTLTGSGPVRVTALQAGTIVASLSAASAGTAVVSPGGPASGGTRGRPPGGPAGGTGGRPPGEQVTGP